MPTYSADELVGLASSMFRAAGVPDEDAAVVARSLVDANLCGHDSHGVMRVPQYIDFIRKGTYKTGVPLTVMSETPAVVAADAGWGLGQVQAYRLLEKILPKAKDAGRRGRDAAELRARRATRGVRGGRGPARTWRCWQWRTRTARVAASRLWAARRAASGRTRSASARPLPPIP